MFSQSAIRESLKHRIACTKISI